MERMWLCQDGCFQEHVKRGWIILPRHWLGKCGICGKWSAVVQVPAKFIDMNFQLFKERREMR